MIIIITYFIGLLLGLNELVTHAEHLDYFQEQSKLRLFLLSWQFLLSFQKWNILSLSIFFGFLGPYLRHMEVPRLEAESELQLLAYTTATPQPQQHKSVTYTTAHCNARSLTHWAKPGIEPTSSWILVRFVSTSPQREFLKYSFNLEIYHLVRKAKHL